MAGFAGSLHASIHEKSAISIPFVVLAALLMGFGIFAVTYWLITFNWLAFAGVLPVVVGALMMFDTRAGADRGP